jgi:hypothetical protein
MFLATIIASDIDKDLLNKLFSMDEILTFIRQLTHLINTSNYLQLQIEQWTYYYHLGITESIWTGRISKKMALDNSICYTYGRQKISIAQRLKKYSNNLVKIDNAINEYISQVPTLLINVDKIIAIITDLINKGHYQLSMEFKRRRNMLKFDAKDHELVHTFYNLKPRQTEVCKNIITINII